MAKGINIKEACVYSGFYESVSSHVAQGNMNNLQEMLEGGVSLQVNAECLRCGSRYRCLVRGGKIIDGSVGKSKKCDSGKSDNH